MEVALVIIGAVVLIGLFVMSMYNGLVSLRNNVKNAFAQMDVQMKNRADLIPGLIETVKGAAGHEKGTLEAVIKARSQVLNAATPEQSMQANNEMTSALNRLMVLVENYPDLKANSNFQQLMAELREAEEKIRYSRQFYNDTVEKYNTRIQVVPTNIIANMFGFTPEKFFEIAQADREAPKVDFSNLYNADNSGQGKTDTKTPPVV